MELALSHNGDLRSFLWRAKCGGREFVCPKCGAETYCSVSTLPETRQCTGCRSQARLRSGTVMESSKLPLELWMQAVVRVLGQPKLSAMQIKRDLALARYETAWLLLFKLREALEQHGELSPEALLTRPVTA